MESANSGNNPLHPGEEHLSLYRGWCFVFIQFRGEAQLIVDLLRGIPYLFHMLNQGAVITGPDPVEGVFCQSHVPVEPCRHNTGIA